MSALAPGVVAVLATTGGETLDRTLRAFGGTGRRVVVVDPLGAVTARTLACLTPGEAHRAFDGERVLAVMEGEAPTGPLGAALCDGLPASARVAVRHVGTGWSLEPRLGAWRCGAWSIARFGFRPAGTVSPGPRPTHLPGALVAEYGDVESALARLDAAAAAVAALVDEAGGTVTLGGTMMASLAATIRALLARAPTRLGAGRWIGAAVLGYAEILARIKVHERRGRP